MSGFFNQGGNGQGLNSLLLPNSNVFTNSLGLANVPNFFLDNNIGFYAEIYSFFEVVVVAGADLNFLFECPTLTTSFGSVPAVNIVGAVAASGSRYQCVLHATLVRMNSVICNSTMQVDIYSETNVNTLNPAGPTTLRATATNNLSSIGFLPYDLVLNVSAGAGTLTFQSWGGVVNTNAVHT